MRGELSLSDRRTQRTQVFSPSGDGNWQLSALYDRHDNRIDFLRTEGLLTEVRHSDGYVLALSWQQQQLTGIDLVTPEPQRLVTCGYDRNGFLAECDTFQFTHLWHEYSPEGFMTRWRDTDKTCVDIGYDAQGRAVSTRSTEGYYDDRFIYNDEEKCTTYLDAEGGETRYWYNEDGLVTRSLDPLGREETAVRENTQLQSRTDALGRTTEYQYNDEGDIRQVTLPGGYSVYYDYNEAGQLTRLTTPDRQVWRWDYDEYGSIVSLTDPQGRVQQFSYSGQGVLLRQIMPGGATWQWNYDALHQFRETTAPDGGVTQTEQDILGRLLSVKDPLGFTTQFRHSQHHAGPQGSVEEISRPDGVRELIRQNSEKLPESFTDGEGKTTRYEYGAFDLLTAVVRPDGERLECRYDKLTRLTEIINAEGERYRLEYDKAGQLIAETDFTGRTLTYKYDAAGRCIRTTFPDGTHLSRQYSVTDQVTYEEVTQGDSDRVLSRTTFTYDTLCRLTEARNDDATITYEYDNASRVTAETINGRRTEYQYDAAQDTVSQRTTGGITERFTRRQMGYLTAWQIADHTPLVLEHDLCGQEISRQSDAGFSLRQNYTPTGMLTEQQAGDLTELNPHYRRNNTLHRQWLYDKACNLTMIADSLRGTMVNSLTANDQISHATWTGSSNTPMQEERFTYDKNLNISRRQTWMNLVMESEANQRQLHGRVTSKEDKAWRHSTSRINPDSGMPEEGKFVDVIRDEQTTWKYDVNGRLVEKRVDKGGWRPLTWRYRWDARSQLAGLETPEGERWEYKYDPFGRRISKRCTNRDKPGMDFHWNGDQLAEEIPVGADGMPEYENAIRWIYEPGSFTPLARYEKGQLHYAVTDTVGRIQELLTEDGTIVWRGKQQLWGREESRNKEDAPSCRLRFPGQYEDEESGLYYNRFRYYDCGTGQYLCGDPIGLNGGINLYAYVKNPLTWIDPLGLAGCNAQFPSRKAAFKAAKRDAGIPMNQHPIAVEKVQLTDRDGHAIKDSDFNILESREYHYTRPDGSRVVIQEHSAGHTYGPPGTPGNQGPHFNPRPFDPKTGNGSRNGSVSGSYDHYEFPRGL
jgi:RHS repeat-associated protein